VHLFLCSTGFEGPLASEIGRHARRLCAGVVAGEGAPADFVFARQILPDAVLVEAPSIARLADSALAHLGAALDADARPFRLDVLVPDDPEDPIVRRAALLEQALSERAQTRWRRLWRRRTEGLDADGALAQILLLARTRLGVSVSGPAEAPGGGPWPVPFRAGRVAVADDWGAPSSAFRKLEEALAWLGRAPTPGQMCVDLGAAPGGWSHVALARGAVVTAVDRAPLSARIARHPRLTQLRRDGFSYAPAQPVDWLLCDIIAEPRKSLALIERWLAQGWCRNLVAHLKFKGRLDYGPAQEARAFLATRGLYRWRVKHLYHDRNEVTVLAAREPLGYAAR